MWKTLDTTDSALLERLTSPDVDVACLFQADREQQKPAVDVEKQRLERFETETFYLSVSVAVAYFGSCKWICFWRQFCDLYESTLCSHASVITELNK